MGVGLGDKWVESLDLCCWATGLAVMGGVLDAGVLFLER